METDNPLPGSRARLLIAEDNELVRLGLRTMLTSEPDLEVVGEASTGREAVAFCQRLQPDIVLMDVTMSDLDGLATTRLIKQEWPQINVLIVTMSEDLNSLLEAFRVGVSGYILINASRREVVEAVRQVLNGESPLDPRLASKLIRRLAHGQEKLTAPPSARLTPRELDVLRLVAEGKTNAEIGQALFVSHGTVKIHVEHIIDKLGVSDRTQAAVRALASGLLNPR
jgi:DNA-binding NarL/FixJ family response regulator